MCQALCQVRPIYFLMQSSQWTGSRHYFWLHFIDNKMRFREIEWTTAFIIMQAMKMGMNASLFQEVSSLPALFSTVPVEDVLAGREVQWVKKTWPILSFINPCLSFPLCKNEDNKVLPKHSHPSLKKIRERKIRWEKTHKKADLSLNMSIITLNVNRPNALVKRQRWGDQIKKQNPVLCCLQEAQE